MSADEQDRQVSEHGRLSRLAMFVVDDYIIDMRQNIRTDSEMVHAAVSATIAFLIGRQLVTVRPQEELPEWLNASIPEHLIPR